MSMYTSVYQAGLHCLCRTVYSVKIKYMHVSRVLFQTFLLLHLSTVSPNSGTLAKLKDVLSVGV